MVIIKEKAKKHTDNKSKKNEFKKCLDDIIHDDALVFNSRRRTAFNNSYFISLNFFCYTQFQVSIDKKWSITEKIYRTSKRK